MYINACVSVFICTVYKPVYSSGCMHANLDVYNKIIFALLFFFYFKYSGIISKKVCFMV